MSGNKDSLTAGGGTAQEEDATSEDQTQDAETETGVARDGQMPSDAGPVGVNSDGVQIVEGPEGANASPRGQQFREDVSSGAAQSDTDIRRSRDLRREQDASSGSGGFLERVENAGSGVIKSAQNAGEEIGSGAKEILNKVEEQPGGEQAATVLAVGAPASAAEPTPAGEVAVGLTAAGILAGGAIAERTNVDEQIRDELDKFPQFSRDQSTGQQQQDTEGEVPLGPTVPQSEIDVGDTSQGAELQPSRSRRDIAEVEPGTQQTSEIDIADPEQGSEVGPGITTAPVATGISEVREQQREQILTGEDIVNDEAASEVDDKLEQIRDQLERRQNQFEREFGEGTAQSGVRERTQNRQQQNELTRVEQPTATGTGTGQGVGTGTLTPPVGFPDEFGSDPQPGQGVASGGDGGSRSRPQRPPRVEFDLRDSDDERDREDSKILEKLSGTGIGGAEDFEQFEEEVLETDDPLGEALDDNEEQT